MRLGASGVCLERKKIMAEALSMVEQNNRYRAALELMTKSKMCDCGCQMRNPILLKPQHYYAIAKKALGIGADESRDADQAGTCARSHVTTANNDANLVCCDLASIPNAERDQ